MRVLLTGITGNLGYSLGLSLISRDVAVIPLLRTPHEAFLQSYPGTIESPCFGDLLMDINEMPVKGIDAIVHAAGDVHFTSNEHSNERMMRTVVAYASSVQVPIHYVGTAYTYKPEGHSDQYVNEYERDKARAEAILVASGIPHSVYRPSVLTGRTDTGELRTYNGYYRIVRAFVEALREGERHKRPVRFPRMLGTSNIVPVDVVSEYIAEAVHKNSREDSFLTNPSPPNAQALLMETLEILGLSTHIQIQDISFEEYAKQELTDEERALYAFALHVRAYWSSSYDFPHSVFTENYISREYLLKTLSAYTHHYV
jgi:thioester reductase-like protein